MFTGIIEEIGIVSFIKKETNGVRLSITAKNILKDIKIGDSISINGVCLTTETFTENSFSVFVSEETLLRTTFKNIPEKTYVNLERALQLSDRLGGHLVLGHTDATGRIISIIPAGDSYLLEIEIPRTFTHLCVFKGSIAFDGISLTIADIANTTIKVAVIPHTFENTTLKFKKSGDEVNIEFDVIGKYLFNFFNSAAYPKSSVTEDLLKKTGFWE